MVSGPNSLPGTLVICGFSTVTTAATGSRARNGPQTACPCPWPRRRLQIRACRSGCHSDEDTQAEPSQAGSLHPRHTPRGMPLTSTCSAAHRKDLGRLWSLPAGPGVPTGVTVTGDCGCNLSEVCFPLLGFLLCEHLLTSFALNSGLKELRPWVLVVQMTLALCVPIATSAPAAVPALLTCILK